MSPHRRSREIYDRALRVTPLGVHSTSRLRQPHPLYFARAEGPYVYDVDGNRYVDLGMGNGAVILGHGHPVVQTAIRRAAEAGLTCGLEVPWAVAAAERLAAMVPGVEAVLFTNTGTEASLHALRIARAYTGRRRIAKVEASYHGWHDAVWVSTWPDVRDAERAGPRERPRPQPGAGGLDPRLVEDTVILPFNDAEAARRILRDCGQELAAVVVEPTMIDVGYIPAAPGYLEALRQETARQGIVLIFDELLTGFRLGKGGAQGRYGVTPDLSTFGKAIANGHVLAAVAGRRDLLAVIGRPGGTAFVGTFNGHALSTAVCEAVLRYLDTEPVLELLEEATQGLIRAFGRAAAAAGLTAHMVGAGGHIHWYFTPRPPRDYRDAAATDGEAYGRFIAALARDGYLVNPGPLSHHAISLAHCQEEVLAGLEGALARAVEACAGTCV